METGHKNSGARESILSSIRRNLNASLPFDAVNREHHGHADEIRVITPASLDIQTLTENFKANVESVGGKCTVVNSEAEAAAKILEVVSSIGAKTIAISDAGIVKRLVEHAGIPVTENASKEYLFGSDLGITSAQWAIAETGTLVLESGRESHRLTSLIPPVHLCILNAGNILQTLGEILETTSKELSAAVTFITGASRTSDIELTLAIGVHGPGELHVIIITD